MSNPNTSLFFLRLSSASSAVRVNPYPDYYD